MSGGHRRNVVHSERVEKSLALGDDASCVEVALERRRVVVVVAAAADLQVGPVDQRPVVDGRPTLTAGQHDHGDQHDGVDADDDSEVRQSPIRGVVRAVRRVVC